MGLQYLSEESSAPTSPAAGQVVLYPKTDHFMYWKDSTGTVRTVIQTTGTLTSGRVPYATTSGVLTDSANLTFDGTRLTGAYSTASQITSTLTAGNVLFDNSATTGFLLVEFQNTSGGCEFGINGSSATDVMAGGTAYATVMCSFTATPVEIGSNNTRVAKFDSSGMTLDTGLLVGAATGGFKGTGTSNFASDIYKNNTAYTNPDYVLEFWATGKIRKYAHKEGAKKYKGRKSLNQVRSYAKRYFHLPRFGQNAGHGAFSGGDALLAALEEAYLHIFDLHDRLNKLEKKCPPQS